MSDPLTESSTLVPLAYRAAGLLTPEKWDKAWKLVGVLTEQYRAAAPALSQHDFLSAPPEETVFLVQHDGSRHGTGHPEHRNFRSVLHSLAIHPRVDWVPALALYVEHYRLPEGFSVMPGTQESDYPEAQRCTTLIMVTYNNTRVCLSGVENSGLQEVSETSLPDQLQLCLGYMQRSFSLSTRPFNGSIGHNAATTWALNARRMMEEASFIGRSITWEDVLNLDPVKYNPELGTTLVGETMTWEYLRRQAVDRNSNPFVQAQEAAFLDSPLFGHHMTYILPSLSTLFFEMDILGYSNIAHQLMELQASRGWQ